MSFNPRNPSKYLGTDKTITFFVTRDYTPTGADYKQPETGRLYSIGTVWQVGKDPTSGTEGDLWMLSKIVANVAYWVQVTSGVTPSGGVLTISDTAGTLVYPTVAGNIQLEAGAGISVTSDAGNNKLVVALTGGSGAVDSIAVDDSTGPGTNPVVPDANGLVTVNGAVVAAHSIPIETHSRAANKYNVEVQVAKHRSGAPLNMNDAGICSFDDTAFTVDSNGYVSLAGGGLALTITTDDSTAVNPTSNNWNLVGLGETSTESSVDPNVQILSPRLNEFVVDPTLNNGTHQTIAAAISAASANDTIFIRPGTYTEDPTIDKNLTFVAIGDSFRETHELQVEIVGKVTCATDSTNVTFKGIRFTTNGDYFLSVTASSHATQLINCQLQAEDNIGMLLNGTATTSNIYIESCSGSASSTYAYFTCTAGVIFINDSFLEQTGTISSSTVASGNIRISNSHLRVPITTSGTGQVYARHSQWGSQPSPWNNTTWITTSGTAQAVIDFCSFYSGTASAISIGSGTTVFCAQAIAHSSNTNVITGSGTLKYGNIVFTGSSSNTNVSTETAYTIK